MQRPSSEATAAARGGLVLVAAMAALMWVVEVVDALDSQRLDSHGIVPRTDEGLLGIVFAPFLHAGFDHLIGNTVPFLALGAVIALRGAGRVLAVTVIVALTSGLGTWLIGPSSSVHVGASGVVFGYATYLIARGWFDRSLVEGAVGVVVLVVLGGVLVGGLVPQTGISWQGHLFGGVGGVLAARLLAPPRREAGPGRRGGAPAADDIDARLARLAAGR